jgi:hypothetical protein
VVTLKRRPHAVDHIYNVADPAEVEEDLGVRRAQVDAAVGDVLEALFCDAPGCGVHVLAAVGYVDVPVDELVVARRGLDGDADRRRDHVHHRLPVEDNVCPVLGRPSRLAGADRPVVEDLAVVCDSHLVRGQVDDGYVAVTDDECRRYNSRAPGAPTGVPTIEVAIDLHLVADGPVRGRPEVKLDGTEPVPAARHGLAHGDREMGLDGLLRGQGVDRLGEHEDDRLAHSYSDPRGGEDACGHYACGGRRREGP